MFNNPSNPSTSGASKRYIAILGILLIGLGLASYLTEKGAFLTWLNTLQSTTLDVIFNFFTLSGNGIFILTVSVVLFVFRKFNWRLPLWNALLYLGSGLLVQIPKRIMDAPRPKKFYGDAFDQFQLPIWTDFGTHNSFPSGHTTSAFAMLVFFALISKSEGWRYVFLTIAVFAGISRVYLLQHFLMDVSAGAVIGSVSAIITWFLVRNKLETS